VLKPDAITGLYDKAPILIPSTESKRIVGCCCEDDYEQIVWSELYKNYLLVNAGNHLVLTSLYQLLFILKILLTLVTKQAIELGVQPYRAISFSYFDAPVK
jgi:hypothetical protein